jgi:vitamin B12 transporter
VKWTRRHYTLYVDMTNLTAHRYCDLANVVQPGFLVTAGASVSI